MPVLYCHSSALQYSINKLSMQSLFIHENYILALFCLERNCFFVSTNISPYQLSYILGLIKKIAVIVLTLMSNFFAELLCLRQSYTMHQNWYVRYEAIIYDAPELIEYVQYIRGILLGCIRKVHFAICSFCNRLSVNFGGNYYSFIHF